MCLAIPGKVLSTYDQHGVRMAKVQFGGVVREACLECVPEVQAGEYVLVHVGFALSRIDEAEAGTHARGIAGARPTAKLEAPAADEPAERAQSLPGKEGLGQPAMKYLDEYRDGEIAARIVDKMRRTLTRPWVLMEVCGGQTHSIVKNGSDYLLPAGVELVHGPGCRSALRRWR